MLADDRLFDARILLPRVYRTAIFVWCLGSALLAMAGATVVVGFATGGALSLLLLVAQERMVKAVLARPGPRPVRKFVLLSLLKYLGVCAAIWLLLRYQMMNPFAFCAGILLVPAAIWFQAAMMALGAPQASEARKD